MSGHARHGVALGALALLVVAGCRSARLAGDSTWCPRRAPAGLVAFDAARPELLAGTYRLLLVGDNETSRGYREGGTLTLWVQDPVRRRRGILGPLAPGRERVLAAAYERAPRDTSAEWRLLASRDPDRPGGVYQHGQLRLGGYDVLDGTGEHLRVLWTSGDGFRGVWASDLGIGMVIDRASGRQLPNPAGFFCAQRVGPAPVVPGT